MIGYKIVLTVLYLYLVEECYNEWKKTMDTKYAINGKFNRTNKSINFKQPSKSVVLFPCIFRSATQFMNSINCVIGLINLSATQFMELVNCVIGLINLSSTQFMELVNCVVGLFPQFTTQFMNSIDCVTTFFLNCFFVLCLHMYCVRHNLQIP